MMANNNVSGTITSESQLRNLLESLSLTENIQSLQTIFSTLGYYILCNLQHSELIIKFKPLYDKILLVLNHGLSSKTRLILTLITSIILAESGTNPSKAEGLRMYAQNMIRINGCLSALCHLFTNSMLQNETWIALCQALSEACHKSVLNQNFCSHLIPLCIERCRRSNTEVLLVLHSLLVDHHKNIKVFYESGGMTIFSRETLLHTSYLCTLNTVLEGTTQSHVQCVRNSNSIFQCLRRWALADENGSAVTKWAVVVLYSRRKLLGADANLCDESIDHKNENNDNVQTNSGLVGDQNGFIEKKESIENSNTETQDLFRNVMKEVYDWKVQSQRKGIPHIPLRLKGTVFDNNMSNSLARSIKRNFPKQHQCSQNLKNNTFKKQESVLLKCKSKLDSNMSNYLTGSLKKKHESFLNVRNNSFCRPNRAGSKCGKKRAARDLSFSFLLKENHDDHTRVKSSTYTAKSTQYSLDCKERSQLTHSSYLSKLTKFAINSQRQNMRRKETTNNDTFTGTTLTLNSNHSKVFTDFRPKRFSTPESKNQKHITPSIKTLNKDATYRRYSPRGVKNISMTSKVMDIINVSCTTIVKGLSKIKKVFIRRSSENKNDFKSADDTNLRDCSYSFTNYMRERDAMNGANTGLREASESSTSSPSACQTCNNTLVLKRKLLENSSLRECVKKLKLGINVYGCDFKKISRVMWPREAYMKPEVLHSLYRKLIAK